ncbi:hypothetical protein AVEN_187671-2 [Araneus ventricosus]|uniref:Thyroglobulin type-1 domain-containing protein n=1 Tax=Araneus ventricosus TaxID=182803 RepID=A0A4Y2M928_ARAVE|nr:hypothetical protein AVEN_187671-2 [Araneus ventricosus]
MMDPATQCSCASNGGANSLQILKTPVVRISSASFFAGFEAMPEATCLCHAISYERSLIDKESGRLECDNSGYFKPLQCSKKTGECWCVTKYGNQVTPPSSDRKSCDDVAHLL